MVHETSLLTVMTDHSQVKLGKKLKKNSVAVDIINFGEVIFHAVDANELTHSAALDTNRL